MLALVLILFGLELGGGVATNSLALVSDSFHMLSDSMSLIIGYIALVLSKRGRSKDKSYGWERAEILGGLINGCLLVTISVFIFIEALQRLAGEKKPLKDQAWIIGIGAVGLVFNVAGMFMFGGHGHSHGGEDDMQRVSLLSDDGAVTPLNSHGHSHNHGDMNSRAIFLHVMGDAMASGAVVISGIVSLTTGWDHIDPIVSICISIVIIYSAIPLVKQFKIQTMMRQMRQPI